MMNKQQDITIDIMINKIVTDTINKFIKEHPDLNIYKVKCETKVLYYPNDKYTNMFLLMRCDKNE